MASTQKISEVIYLDHAAATPVDKAVVAAMLPFMAEKFYNPSATYAPAMVVAKDLLAARTQVAHWFGARPSEIVFTAGGTEANNLAIHGVMRHYVQSESNVTNSTGSVSPADLKTSSGANIVISAIEHDAVLKPAGRYDCRLVQPDNKGIVQADAVEAAIDDRTVLVSVMYANNEIGSIQPIRDIARRIQTIRDQRRRDGNDRPLYFHTDACQAANYLDLHAARLGADLITINGGKIYGPKQSGVLYVKAGLVLLPLVEGGGQEQGLRSGTENVAASIGLAKALDIAQQSRSVETKRLQSLQVEFIAALQKTLPQTIINGSLKKRLPNNIHLTIPGQDNERLILMLESHGILAAAGSACSAASGQPSHVLRAIGLSDADAQASLRFTMGRVTTGADMSRTIAALSAIVS